MVMTIRPGMPRRSGRAGTSWSSNAFRPRKPLPGPAFSQRLAVFPEHFWIAEENGEIVACVNGCVSDAPLLQDEMFEDAGLHNEQGAWQMLFGVETHPVVQGKGYASALMRPDDRRCPCAGAPGRGAYLQTGTAGFLSPVRL